MEYNDYELVSLAQEGNEDAITILHKKYMDLISSKSKKIFNYLRNKGLELSDVMQEAMIGFEEAIKAFNQDDNAIFYTFAMICIDRQLKSLVIKHNRNKHKILNEAIALDSDDECDLYNIFSKSITLENEFFDKEETKDLYNRLKGVLTDFESIVFELRLQGCNYNEIANIVDVDSKGVYNAISRIRNKANRLLNK